MTITLNFPDQQSKDEFKSYMKEIYEYIDLDKENIPGAFQELDSCIIAYFTDEFFTYGYKFFIEQLLLGLNGAPNDKKYLDLIARYFRLGSEEYLMSNVILNK